MNIIACFIITAHSAKSPVTITPSNNVYIVADTVYYDFGNSGCIQISKAACTVRVTDVSFVKCVRTNGRGGGLYISSLADGTFERVCGNQCSANDNGQVLFLQTTGTSGYYVKANNMASSNCGDWTLTTFIGSGGMQDAFGFTQGNQSFRSFNSSTNSVKCDGAAFESWKSSSCDLKFCSFMRCRGVGIFSLYAYYATHGCLAERFVEYANVYNNTLPKKGLYAYGLFSIVGKWTLRYVVMKDNHDTTGGTDISTFNFGQALTVTEDIRDTNAIFIDSSLDSGIDMKGTPGKTVILENCKIGNAHTTQRIIHWQTTFCPAEFSATFTPYQIDYGHPIFSAMFSAFAVSGEI